MIATIYNISTGMITGVIKSPDLETVLLNVLPTEAVIASEYDPSVHYIGALGPAELPTRPGDWAVWNGSAWIDPRTPETLASELNALRRDTWLDKSDLLIRLATFGILTDAEAEDAAGGAIPARMNDMLATVPAEAQMAARVKWRADVQIGRMHPVIVAAAYALNLSDETVDAIFGITPEIRQQLPAPSL